MVASVVGLSRNGLRDWLIQRVTAVYMFLYLVFFSVVMLRTPLDFVSWQALFHSAFTQILTILFLISLLLHAWLGLWIVSTDYIKTAGLRIVFQALVLFLLASYLVWGIKILWGL